MQILWKLKKAFVKRSWLKLPKTNPLQHTSTIVRNLEEKGYVAHNAYGNTHQYYYCSY
jgi:predicted transcriptional regulator